MTGPSQDRPEGIADERATPEFQATASGSFMPDPIDGNHINAVGDRVRALNQLPGLVLRRPKLGFLAGVPADGRGVKKDLGSLKGRQPGRLGIPLVPANQSAEPAEARVKGSKAQVAGSEIILLVVKGIVGYVHLAVDPQEGAVRIEDR